MFPFPSSSMKINSSFSRAQKTGINVILASGLLMFPALNLSFGQTVWDGGGADDFWGTAANWVGDATPLPGLASDIAFDGSVRLNSTNNYTAFDDFHNVVFNSGAGSFVVTGNAIDLYGKIENNSTNLQTFNLAIGTGSVSGGFIEINPTVGDLNFGGANVFLGNNQLRVWGNNGKTLTFGSGTIISGTGATLAINQNSNVVFQSAHTYTGASFINAGKLVFAAGGSANSSTLNLLDTSGSVNAAIELAPLTGGLTLSSPLVVRAGSSGTASLNSLNTSGTNTMSGGATLNKGLSISTTTGGTLALSGVISGSGGLTVAGGGTLALTGNNTFSGGTTVNGGTVTLNSGNSTRPTGSGTLTINTGGVVTAVAGTGGSAHNNFGNYTLGTTVPIVINGGTLNPSEYNHMNSLTMSAGAVNAGASAGGDGLDFNTSASVAPSITYNGTTSTATIAAKITTRAVLTMNVADGAAASDLTVSSAIVGAGSVTKTGAGVLTLAAQTSYTGGTVVNGGILDLTGPGGTAGVIRGTVTVNSGATLRLNANDVTGYQGDASSLRTINLVGGTLNVNTILGTSGNQTLGGATITMTAGTISGVAGSNLDMFTGPSNTGPSAITTLAAATSSTISSQLRLRQNAATVFTVADGAAAVDLLVSGPLVEDVAGRALVKEGAGVMAFSTQKTYSGGTTVNGGILDLTAAGGSGGIIRGTVTVNTGAMLRLSAGDVTGFGTGADRLGVINLNGGTMHVAVQGAGLNQTLGNATVNLTGGFITGVAGSNLDFFQTTSNLNSLASATTSTISGTQLSIRQAAGLTITTANGTTGSGVDLDISSPIASSGGFGSAPLIKAGAGTLKLSGANLHTSATNINAGKLIVSANNALGTNAAGTTLASGATLDFQNVAYATAEALAANGGTISGSTGTSSFAGVVTLGGDTPVVVAGTELTLGGAISGGFGVTKTGAGRLVLGGANSYTGATQVNGGTLAISGAATVVGNISIASGSVFDVSGATGGSFTLGSGQSFTAGRASSPANDILGSLVTGAGSTLNILSGAGTVGTLTGTGNLTFGGGTVNFDLSNVVASGNDRINIGGSLALSSATTLAFNRINGSLTNGSYVLVQGTGAVAGSLGNLSTTGLILGTTRQTFTLSSSTVANALTLDVAGSAADLIWNNAASTGLWSTAPADQNWDNASVNDRFYDADTVTFQNISGQPTQTVGVTGTLTPGSITVNNTLAGTTFTLNAAGKITGASGITKTGDGVLILANTGGNDFTGGTNINAGTLLIGNAAAVSQGSTITIASGAKLDVNGLNVTVPSVLGSGVVESTAGAGTLTSATTATIAAVLQDGAGGLSLVKNGVGTTSLTGTNTYTGPTTVSAGTLQIGNGGTTGSLGGTTITNNSVLAINRSDAFTFANNVSGSGVFNQVGSGTTAITGSLTHTGGTTISSGTLQIGNGGTIGSIVGNITANGTLAVNRSDAVSLANLIGGTGGVSQLGNGTTTLTGANTYTGATVITAGTLSISSVANAGTPSNIGQSSTSASNLVLNGGVLKYTGATGSTNRGMTANNVAGNILEVTNSGTVLTMGTLSGAGGFTKTGNGELTLNATNSDMAGGLTVAAGIVNLVGGNNGFSSIGGGTLTINSGTTVRAFTHNSLGQGTGTALSPLVINGGTFEADQYNHINSITMTGGLLGIRSGVTQVDGMDMKVRNTVNPTITSNAAATSAVVSSKLTANAPLTFNVADGAAATDLEVSGLIVGGSLITKAGAGKLVLSANNTATGGTTISAGTLQLGTGGTTGFVTGNITNNAALIFNRSDAISYASTIGGTGSVTKEGAGTLTYTVAQGYTGGTTVNAGILQLNASLAASSSLVVNPSAQVDVNTTNILFNGVGVTLNGGTLQFIGGAHNHFNGTLTLNGGTISTAAGSTAYDGVGNYAIDSTTVTVGGSAVSTISANTGVHLNGSPNFIVADATGNASADLLISANLRDKDGGGARGLTKSGVGTLVLTGANTYTGSTIVSDGTLSLGTGGSLADSSTLSLTGSGSNFSIAAITGPTERVGDFSGVAGSTALLGANTLEFGTATDTTFAGTLSTTGGGGINKLGAGVFTLASTAAFSGSPNISITQGTFLTGANNLIPDNSAFTLSGGKLATGGFSDTVGSLTVASNSILDLGTSGGTAVWTFANSASQSWTGLMEIWNWSGALAGGGSDQLGFGAGGLTQSQIDKITFLNPAGMDPGTYGAKLLGNGELVPVPEPGALSMCGILIALIGLRDRRSAMRARARRN